MWWGPRQSQPKLLPMLATTGMVGWLAVVLPVALRDVYREQAPIGWWLGVLGFLAAYLMVIPGIAQPRLQVRPVPAIGMLVAASVANVSYLAAGITPVLFTIAFGSIGFIVRPRWVVAGLAASSVLLAIKMRADDWELEWAAIFIAVNIFAAIMIEIAIQEVSARRELTAVAAELRLANSMLERSSRDEERLRISRDLHDTLGHQLTALTLNLEVALHLATGDVVPHIEQSRKLAGDVLADIRGVVSQMRDRGPLGEELRRLAHALPQPPVTVDVDPTVETEDGEAAYVLSWVAREGLTNAARHAAATGISVAVHRDQDGLTLDISDDGRGSADLVAGNGIRGMRERLEAVGGSLQVTSWPGGGTRLRATVPDAVVEDSPSIT